MSDSLEKIVTAVSQATKYRHITPNLVRRIGAQELQKRRSYKEALKATKNKLHQVGGAYQESKINYEQAVATLESQPLRDACLEIMPLHASTAERLPILDDFYSTLLADLPPIHSILDIASGLNPLTRPWMPLPDDVQYTAVDIYTDMMDFLNRYFDIAGINGRAVPQDVISNPPTEPVDVALILKTLPVLEMVDKTAVSTLLDALTAKYLIISFPLQSLGGRKKGMAEHYAQQFERWKNGRFWQVKTFTFATELVYLVKTINEESK